MLTPLTLASADERAGHWGDSGFTKIDTSIIFCFNLYLT